MKVLAGLALLLFVSFSDAGTTFTRWGRKVCPTGASVLYKGYMTGPNWGAGGSGSNTLCAHEEPKFPRGTAGRQGSAGLLQGIELDLNIPAMKALFLTDNMNGGEVTNQDMPCVVCYVADSYDKIMIPGRPDCGSTGFDLQYHGYLVSQMSDERKRGEFVCMDESPEGTTGGTADNNNAVVYPVEVGCGSLPCNPYIDGMEMACAVCTY